MRRTRIGSRRGSWLILLSVVIGIGGTFSSARGQVDIGDWRYTYHQDGMTDEDRSFVFTVDTENDGALTFKCWGDDLIMMYHLGEPIGESGQRLIDVRYRIDRNTAAGPYSWVVIDQDRETLQGSPTHLDARLLLQDMTKGLSVLFEAEASAYDKQRNRFSLDGLSATSRHLACVGKARGTP